MTHTPGPWFAHNIGLGPNGEGPFTYPLGTDPDKAAANARLIAAAPDMLELLEDWASVLADGVSLGIRPGSSAHVILREAIAKAKGREPCGK